MRVLGGRGVFGFQSRVFWVAGVCLVSRQACFGPQKVGGRGRCLVLGRRRSVAGAGVLFWAAEGQWPGQVSCFGPQRRVWFPDRRVLGGRGVFGFQTGVFWVAGVCLTGGIVSVGKMRGCLGFSGKNGGAGWWICGWGKWVCLFIIRVWEIGVESGLVPVSEVGAGLVFMRVWGDDPSIVAHGRSGD